MATAPQWVGERAADLPAAIPAPISADRPGYLRDLWSRREFMVEMSRTTLRAEHFNTVLGQLWLLLNPVLLGLVYFILVDILGRRRHGDDYLAHLLVTLFAFQFITTSIQTGAKSVVGGSRLILNMSFPRLILPLSAVFTAFLQFLPTLVLCILLHVAIGHPIDPTLLWLVPLTAMLAVLAVGLAAMFATLQVYFRDTRSFLPFALRIWLYLSPVLYTVAEVPGRIDRYIGLNPMYPILGAWSQVLVGDSRPSFRFVAGGLLWAVVALVAGIGVFRLREKDFAVRV